MVIKDKRKISIIKGRLLTQLKRESAFWSYDPDSVSLERLTEDQLIAMTIRYLDLPEISELFRIYSLRKVKSAWRRMLVPEGEYLYTLNRFIAWYYFKAKRPDAYLKSLETRHLNKLFATPQ